MLFWSACVLLAGPLAWVIARAGFGLPVHAPLHDLALLALWSASEEIVFRGGLQPLLARRLAPRPLAGVSAANALTSVVFAAAHLPSHAWPVALGVFPISLILGHALERSARLWVPVALHLWFNAALYLVSWLQR